MTNHPSELGADPARARSAHYARVDQGERRPGTESIGAIPVRGAMADEVGQWAAVLKRSRLHP